MKLEKPNHRKHPLRRIVGREKQGKQWFVILACHHASPGRPASRYSRFYPCPVCARFVKQVAKGTKPESEDEMTRFRKRLRKKLFGGTFK